MDVEPMTFNGLESFVGTTGANTVDVTNTSTDLEITTRDGADVFNIENVGTGIVTVNSGDADDEFNVINSGNHQQNRYPGPYTIFVGTPNA